MNKSRLKVILRFAFGVALDMLRSSIKNPKSAAAAKEAAALAVKSAREFADAVEAEFLGE